MPNVLFQYKSIYAVLKFYMYNLKKKYSLIKTFILFLDSEVMLTPERSIEIQNSIGADIIMQLDDVVKTTTVGPRVEEAMNRLVNKIVCY